MRRSERTTKKPDFLTFGDQKKTSRPAFDEITDEEDNASSSEEEQLISTTKRLKRDRKDADISQNVKKKKGGGKKQSDDELSGETALLLVQLKLAGANWLYDNL